MGRLRWGVSAFLGVCVAIGISAQPVSADGQTQYRYANTADKKINDQWSIYVYEEFNFDGDSGHDLIGQCNEIGATYSGFAPWFDLTPAYAKYFGKADGEWMGENIPYLAGTLKWEIMDVAMNNKMRIEFDERHALADRWRYRNAYTVTSPVTFTRFEIQPFVSDEIFYDFDAQYLTANELTAGINFKIIKQWRGSIYYLRAMSQGKLSDGKHWKTTPMVAFSTSVSF